jgi:hypothetical protein
LQKKKKKKKLDSRLRGNDALPALAAAREAKRRVRGGARRGSLKIDAGGEVRA